MPVALCTSPQTCIRMHVWQQRRPLHLLLHDAVLPRCKLSILLHITHTCTATDHACMGQAYPNAIHHTCHRCRWAAVRILSWPCPAPFFRHARPGINALPRRPGAVRGRAGVFRGGRARAPGGGARVAAAVGQAQGGCKGAAAPRAAVEPPVCRPDHFWIHRQPAHRPTGHQNILATGSPTTIHACNMS